MDQSKDNSRHLEIVLPEAELMAVEMKFEGFNYIEISQKTGINYKTVRTWFAKNGKLYDYYRAYAQEESKLRRAEAHDTFKAHLNNAVRTLVQVMNKGKLEVARVQAAKEIINRQLGEPLKVVATDEDKVNPILEAIRLANEEIQGTDTTREGEDSPESSQ